MTCAPPLSNNPNTAAASSSAENNGTKKMMLPTNKAEPKGASLQEARFQVKLPTVISAMTNSTTALPANYQPQPADVKCGRGKGAYNQPGNVQFRQVVERFRAPYLRSRTVTEKTALLNAIIDEYQDVSGGRFIRRAPGGNAGWIELSREEIRAKVGHAMRQVIAVAQKKEGTVPPASNNNKTTKSAQAKKIKSQQPQPPAAPSVQFVASPIKPKSPAMSRFEELVAQIVQDRLQQQPNVPLAFGLLPRGQAFAVTTSFTTTGL